MLKMIRMAMITSIMLFGSSSEYIAQQVSTQKHSPIGRMIDIDTHKLHIIETGKEFKGDNPTVIFEHGLHCDAAYWNTIQQELTNVHKMHACSYDRAGIGSSEVSPEPRTIENIAQDLDLLLNNANVTRSRILVGHSFGGLCAQLYCLKHPEKVSGMVLIDAPHEKMLEDMPKEMINLWKWQQYKLSWVQHIPAFLLGYIAASQEKEKLLHMRYPEQYVEYHIANVFKPTYFPTLYNEMENIYTSFNQIKNRLKPFGNDIKPFDNIPLKVILAGDLEDMSAYGCDKLSNFDAATQKIFIEMCYKHKLEQSERSACGQLIVATGCSHRVPLENPDIIVNSVLAVIKEVCQRKNS